MSLLNRMSIRQVTGAAAIAIAIGALGIPFGCNLLFAPVDASGCAEEDSGAAAINVAGVFRYSGTGENEVTGFPFQLSGTITFEQNGLMVRVSGSTYDGRALRSVQSEFAEFSGNRLDLLLTPNNGDPDYRAAVRFVFTEDGNQFCVEFSDTNADHGDTGSFVGVRDAG